MTPVPAKTTKSAILLIDIQNAFNVPNIFDGPRNNERLEENVQTLLEQTRRWNARQRKFTNGIATAQISSSDAIVDVIHIHHHSLNPHFPLHPSFRMPSSNLSTSASSPTAQNRKENDKVDDVSEQQGVVLGVDPLPCARVMDGEPVFIKSVNSAFIGTSLTQYIQANRIRQLFVCGITTDHCVSTSVRMAANLKIVDSVDGQEQGQIWLVEDACATFPRGGYPADLVHKLHIESLRGEFAEITTVEEVVKHVFTDQI